MARSSLLCLGLRVSSGHPTIAHDSLFTFCCQVFDQVFGRFGRSVGEVFGRFGGGSIGKTPVTAIKRYST